MINWKKFTLTAMDLVFPRRCPVCDDAVMPFGELICEGCKEKVKYIGEPYCMKCGKGLRKNEEEYCRDCSRRAHQFSQGAALFDYQSMAASLYRFKYSGRKEYADYYGREMAAKLNMRIRLWNPQALIPVPIHRERMKKRGYNQSQLLANVLSRELQIPTYEKLAVRCRNTIPQKQLGSVERQNNLKKAFKILKNDVELNTIVIIDDIYTTGSTIDSLAYEFKKAGTSHVYFLALTIGKGI